MPKKDKQTNIWDFLMSIDWFWVMWIVGMIIYAIIVVTKKHA